MKKLFLSLAVVMSVSLFSCGNGQTTENADSTAVDTVVAVEEVVAVDTVAGDTVVAGEAAVAVDSVK